MELESGASAILYATTAYAENSPVFIEIAFENGTLRLEGEKLYSFDKSGKITEICSRPDIIYHGQSYWGVGHSLLINDFYDCLKTGRKFSIVFDEFCSFDIKQQLLKCQEYIPGFASSSYDRQFFPNVVYNERMGIHKYAAQIAFQFKPVDSLTIMV